MKVRMEIGTTYCGCPSEVVYFDMSKEDYESDSSSTEMLNAVWNRETPHYFIDVQTDEDPEDWCEEWDEEMEEQLGYLPKTEETDD